MERRSFRTTRVAARVYELLAAILSLLRVANREPNLQRLDFAGHVAKVSEDGFIACAPCAPGFYSESSSARECSACRPGKGPDSTRRFQAASDGERSWRWFAISMAFPLAVEWQAAPCCASQSIRGRTVPK
jgi:hypothetical protein